MGYLTSRSDFLNFSVTWKGSVITMQHKKISGLRVTAETYGRKGATLPPLIKDLFFMWHTAYREHAVKPLNRKQRHFYDVIVGFHRGNGRAPGYQELCDMMGWKSKGTAFYHVRRLIELGWAHKDQNGMVVPIDLSTPEML